MASLHVANELSTAVYNNIKSVIFNAIYPVGSLYFCDKAINPNTLFGGTWVQLKGGFLYGSMAVNGANSYSTGNGTGTSTANHTLTIDQIPSHYHDFWNGGRNLMWDSGLNSYGGLTSGTTVQYTWDCKTKYAGGGQGHSHGIPYIACSIWRRTA